MGSFRVYLAIAVAICLLEGGHAFWFFGSSGRQEAEAPVSEECVRKAELGDCHFYTCFDQRHPCADDNYALHYGWRYCVQFDQHYSRLTPEGKRWVNDTRKCAMEQLLQFYRDDFINCEDVEAEMVEAQGECEAEKGMCNATVIRANSEVFRDIYAVNARTARRLLESVKHCGLTKARQAISWLGDTYTALVPEIQEFFDSIRGVFGNLRDRIDGLIDDITGNSDESE